MAKQKKEEHLVPAPRAGRLFDVSYSVDRSKPVECLGMTFQNDEARRAHFTEKLREKLKDPEFRKIDGFPIAADEDILAMSNPPYYTACPNPFIGEFLSQVGHLARLPSNGGVPSGAVHSGCERRKVGRVIHCPCLSHEGSSQSHRPVCTALHGTGRRNSRRVQRQRNDWRCCSDVWVSRPRIPARSGDGTPSRWLLDPSVGRTACHSQRLIAGRIVHFGQLQHSRRCAGVPRNRDGDSISPLGSNWFDVRDGAPQEPHESKNQLHALVRSISLPALRQRGRLSRRRL